MAISSGRPCSAWHTGLSWKTWVSFVTFESNVEVNLTRLSFGPWLANQPWYTFRTRQSFKTIPARGTSVTLGPWLSRETYFSWRSLWPGGSTKSLCITDETTISFLTFLSNFTRQSWLPWNSRRTPVTYWSGLAFHKSICVAWSSGGSGGPRRALGSISSTWSWQRQPWKSLVTFFSSFTRVARSTRLPWD